MVHDRLASGEGNRTLSREVEKALGLSSTLVLGSVFDGIYRICWGLGLKPGDGVVVSPLASLFWVEGLARLGLVPIFADVWHDSPVLNPETLGPAMEKGPKAIVADACLGYLPDVEALQRWGVPVIEDLTHGLGGRFQGLSIGSRGDVVLAHFSPETLVAGAGGCLVGFRASPPATGEVGPWEALSDLGASLILSQWRDASAFADRKRETYRQLYLKLPKSYRQPKQIGDGEPVFPWFPVLVESGAKDVLSYSRKKAVEADWAFRAQPHLNSDSSTDFCPHARSFLFHTLVFPLYATISSKEMDLLTKVISSLP